MKNRGLVEVYAAIKVIQNLYKILRHSIKGQKTGLLLLAGIMCLPLAPDCALSQSADSRKSMIEQMLPETQVKFIAALSGLANKYREAPNPLRQYQLLEQRSRLLRGVLPDRKVNDWIGRITALGITDKGKAYLGIELSGTNGAKDSSGQLSTPPPSDEKTESDTNIFTTIFSTWHDSFRDLDDKTLIAPGTPLYELAAQFQPGDFVRFSAEGIGDMEDYLKEMNRGLESKLISPKFIFRFVYLEPVVFPEIETPRTKIGSVPPPETGVNPAASVPGDSPSRKVLLPRLQLVPKISVHFYRDYRLSAYDWDFGPYMKRWNRVIRNNWKNWPPSDYLNGKHPQGGEVRVYAAVSPDGRINGIKSLVEGDISQKMKDSVLKAFYSYTLPPLPSHFRHPVLKTEFRFQYPTLPHLLFQEAKDHLQGTTTEGSNVSADTSVTSARIKTRLRRKLQLRKTEMEYHALIRERVEEKFRPLRHFDPAESLTVLLELTHPVSQTSWEIKDVGRSPGFLLSVLNGLSQVRFPVLPSILKENSPHQVQLQIRP